MDSYTIGQIADRTGFTASALRYYEDLGLVAPTARTEAGYRVYDDDVLRRLAFIARAKQLGCSLDEVTDLLRGWDGDQCGPVQRRLHDLLTEKIHSTQDQVAALLAFGAQLQSAAARLGAPPIDGPCGDECACLSDTATATSTATPVALVPTLVDPPVACTLDASAMPHRIAQWQAILEDAHTRSTTTDGRLRIEFGEDVDLGALVRLVHAEQQCCAFFSFTLTFDTRRTALEVGAPDTAAEIVDAVFGRAS